MVEGHSVHRVATRFRNVMLGKSFSATSPNGRFVEGAAAISNQVFFDIQAVGKNLFAFFGSPEEPIVVHVHFGMAGAWAIYDTTADDEEVPAPTKTNRLRLKHVVDDHHNGKTCKLVADLSAMTVNFGDIRLYNDKRSKLGADPLREDANVEELWDKVQATKKSIGALIMDQTYFAGPGNIYRAEILFKAGVHPNTPGNQLTRSQFDAVWHHTVDLLHRGYTSGSILTVDPDEAETLGQPRLRRYIYNTKSCPRCHHRIQTWSIATRTCYACPICQPPPIVVDVALTTTKPHVPFRSHCAPESLNDASQSALSTVVELKSSLKEKGIEFPAKARKRELLQLLTPTSETAAVAVVTPTRGATSCSEKSKDGEETVEEDNLPRKRLRSTRRRNLSIVSAQDAAAEKAVAGESLAVEHIAELAPSQARRARKRTWEKKTARR